MIDDLERKRKAAFEDESGAAIPAWVIDQEARMSAENRQTTETVKAHVEKNRVPVDNGRKICVDDGYQPNENLGALARAGADMGYVQALLKMKHDRPELEALNTPEKCLDLVMDFAQWSGTRFAWHSDHHADPESNEAHEQHGSTRAIIGCGHCAKAANPEFAGDYGVDAADMKRVIEVVRQRYAADPSQFDFVNLDREHKPKGVLVVTSTQFTVNAWDKETGNQFFVYDKTRDQQTAREFAEYLQKERGINISFEELMAALDFQTEATLSLLAEGLPIYQVNLDSENTTDRSVAFAGDVISLDKLRKARQ